MRLGGWPSTCHENVFFIRVHQIKFKQASDRPRTYIMNGRIVIKSDEQKIYVENYQLVDLYRLISVIQTNESSNHLAKHRNYLLTLYVVVGASFQHLCLSSFIVSYWNYHEIDQFVAVEYCLAFASADKIN